MRVRHALGLLVSVLMARSAAAHDHASASPLGETEALEASVSVGAAHFAIPGFRKGDYFTLLPALRASNAARVWALAALPIHYLTFVGDSEFGPGDLMVAAGFGGVRSGRLALDASLWTMWPTGNSHASLGSAHVMLAPQLDGGLQLGRWRAGLSMALRGAIPWGEHGMHEHQPLVAPHDLLDLKFTARGSVKLFDRLELSAQADPVFVFIPHPVQPVGTRVTAGLGAALTLGSWRGEIGFALPLTTNRAWDWQFGASIAARLSEPGTDSKIAGR